MKKKRAYQNCISFDLSFLHVISLKVTWFRSLTIKHVVVAVVVYLQVKCDVDRSNRCVSCVWEIKALRILLRMKLIGSEVMTVVREVRLRKIDNYSTKVAWRSIKMIMRGTMRNRLNPSLTRFVISSSIKLLSIQFFSSFFLNSFLSYVFFYWVICVWPDHIIYDVAFISSLSSNRFLLQIRLSSSHRFLLI